MVLGVSPDGVKSHQRFKTKYNLPFILLADEHAPARRRLRRLGREVVHGQKALWASSAATGIDEQGNIADAQVNVSPNDSVRGRWRRWADSCP